MKLNTYFVLSLLLSASFTSAYHLESKLLQGVDGYMMNGPTIAMIKRYQFESKRMLVGALQPDKIRVGTYMYQNQNYSVTQLSELEKEHSTNQELQNLLQEMIEDFERISLPFQQSVRSAKPIMETLILQSSKLRERGDSLLNKWADKSVIDDRVLFKEHMHTIKGFETFLIDLYNFLDDLVESCPKGLALYKKYMREQLQKNKNKSTENKS